MLIIKTAVSAKQLASSCEDTYNVSMSQLAQTYFMPLNVTLLAIVSKIADSMRTFYFSLESAYSILVEAFAEATLGCHFVKVFANTSLEATIQLLLSASSGSSSENVVSEVRCIQPKRADNCDGGGEIALFRLPQYEEGIGCPEKRPVALCAGGASNTTYGSEFLNLPKNTEEVQPSDTVGSRCSSRGIATTQVKELQPTGQNP
eukprot:CAMPEP_0113877788 /NCGR_PEP_ID=MMETSP0780_2-20120614/6304_1 /TAXON_ID=652834 /ORGANISM="Palpitomonas bilix" /LENGTH=203 /DNA_ID=CAMNT_0000864151 /DNA_START=248 /DNA_END=856 /DNA_ORIENTATION=- /assembly_acc=CAM_ASM_000599